MTEIKTPRTDKEANELSESYADSWQKWFSFMELSRQLERELILVTQERDVLQKALINLRKSIKGDEVEPTVCIGMATSAVQELKRERDALRKKLEEAYERAAQVCEDLIENSLSKECNTWPECSPNAVDGASRCTWAIRALKTGGT